MNMVASFVRRTKSERIRTGIDSTGLQPTRASAYYTTVLKKDKKKRRKIKKHIKVSTVLVRKAHRIKPLKIQKFLLGEQEGDLQRLIT